MLYFVVGYKNKPKNEQKKPNTFPVEEPSDVSSPSLPSSQGLRLLGFFFLLLLSLSAPCLSACGILPSAAGNKTTVYELHGARQLIQPALLEFLSSAQQTFVILVWWGWGSRPFHVSLFKLLRFFPLYLNNWTPTTLFFRNQRKTHKNGPQQFWPFFITTISLNHKIWHNTEHCSHFSIFLYLSNINIYSIYIHICHLCLYMINYTGIL